MEFAQLVKSQVDIVRVIGSYVRLRRMGSSARYIGLCPFHQEKTPSFNVNGDHQFFKCFGCGVGGDVFKFVMEKEGLSFYECLQLLAEQNGIPLPKRDNYLDADSRVREAIQHMNELAADAFQRNLYSNAGQEARAYLARRGVNEEIARTFQLGLSERGGHALTKRLEQEGFTREQIEKSGLVGQRQDGTFYDRFRYRLMFPICSEPGKVIGFGGRALADGDEPKYLNSPETELYKKSHVLYNLHRAKEAIRKSERAVLVEGYMDVIGVWSAGVHEVVASCGTALTANQVRALKRHSDRIVVNFDPDTAGANAAERSIQMFLEEGLHVRVLELDGELDPDEYCQQHGADAYRSVLDHARSYFHWLGDRARKKFDVTTTEGRAQALQYLLPPIHRLPDDIQRAAVAEDIAHYLGVSKGLILENFRKSAVTRSREKQTVVEDPGTFMEKCLLQLLISDVDARDQLVPQLKNLPGIERLSTRNVFYQIFALHDAGTDFAFAELDARLEDADRTKLAAFVLADETATEVFSLEQGEACVRRLQNEERDSRVASLRVRIKEAEKSGRITEALEMMQEMDRLRTA